MPVRARHIWWKRLLRVALCLLLGAVTTVGAAWACVLRTRTTVLDPIPDYLGLVQRRWLVVRTPPSPAPALPRIEAPTLEAADLMGPVFVPSQPQPNPWAQPPVRWGDDNVLDVGTFGVRVTCASEIGPGWGDDVVDRRVEAGWPRPALYLYRHDDYFWPSGRSLARLPTEGRGLRGGLAPPWQTPPTSAAYRGDRFLPLAPRWPGFLINTLFYASAWWPVLAAPGFVRRWSRRRRNRCVACGYGLRGLGGGARCPECGA